ncbi:MAG: hypothetical protein KDC61_11805 [Saprospiraceae bacterium]|nr:hypothetical protein [Saprospiraceae bacterium]
MPVEIRELNIKVTVDNPSGGQSSGNNAGNTNNGQPDEALVAAVVEKVLEILKSKTER